MAEIIAFPLARRVAYVAKQASFAAGMKAEACERHIDRQLSIQRATLISKGVDPDAVEAQVQTLGGAIRNACWRYRALAEGLA